MTDDEWMYVYENVTSEVEGMVKSANLSELAIMTKDEGIKPNSKIIGDPFEIVWNITNQTLIDTIAKMRHRVHLTADIYQGMILQDGPIKVNKTDNSTFAYFNEVSSQIMMSTRRDPKRWGPQRFIFQRCDKYGTSQYEITIDFKVRKEKKHDATEIYEVERSWGIEAENASKEVPSNVTLTTYYNHAKRHPINFLPH